MKPITGLLDNGYDDIVTFGQVLAKTVFYGSDEPVDALLDYFEAPHKWESEYQKWRELGGTLDDDCLRAFEDWYDNRDIERIAATMHDPDHLNPAGRDEQQ